VSKPPAPPQTLLRLAGAPACELAGQGSVELAPLDALLLAWLAIVGPTARERLATLLWPGSDADSARNALRQRLFRLRKQLGQELVSGSSVLALAADVQHDLDGAPSLLGQLDSGAGPELQAWLSAERSRRQSQGRAALEAQIAALEAQGDVGTALPLALALVQAEPLSEDAHRRVMRLHYLRGDRAAAMLAFDRCEALLKHEVGTRPGQQTLALLRSIEALGAEPAAAQPLTPNVSAAAQPPAATAATATASARSTMPVTLLRPPRLVGRDAELATLRRSWRAGTVVMVQGEAGMGKSRLLQALAHEAPGLVFAAGRPGDALVPYASVARLLTALVERLPEPPPAALQQRLAPLLPALFQRTVDSLGSAGSSHRHGRASPRSASLLPAVQSLLHSASGHIDGLVLDDVHFADAASVELLQALLTAPRSADPQRWCLGLRPPEPGSRQQALWEALAAAAPLTRVPLQPLDVAQIAELVDSLHLPQLPQFSAGPTLQGAAIAPALRQRSGGNPLFALETLKLAWADGSLFASPAATSGAGAGDEALPRPQSLTQLIGQQLARLSPTALTLARLAAIAGVDFSLLLAEQVLRTPALQLADPWHELETQQVLVGAEFAHDLIFETVLDAVPAVIARHLHAQVAEHLEAGRAEPARIAAHWEAAGQRERALPSLHAAAERAHAALREHERINFLLRAADIAEASGDRAQAFACVAGAIDSHMNTIRQASGYPLLDRLDRLADGAAQQAQALGQRAWYCIQIADEAGALRYGEQALQVAQTLGDAGQVAMLRQRLATALAQAGRFDEALPHFEAVLPLSATLLDDDARAEFHGNFAAVLDNLGQPDAAATHRRSAIESARLVGDRAQQVSQLANHAVSRLNAGDVGEAHEVLEQARRLVSTYEMEGSTVGFVAVLRMQCARAMGRYAQALAADEEAQAVLAHSNPARLPVVQMHRAHCWLDLGQHARAQQALAASAAGAPLPPHFAARRSILAARLQRVLGGSTAERLALLAAARAQTPPKGWPEIGFIVDTEAALEQPVPAALALLEQVSAQAQALSLRGSVLAALVRRTQRLADANDARGAISARQALALAEQVQPTLMYRGELWLHCARALRVANARAEVKQVLNIAREWLDARVEHDVPADFRDSFLQRNPVNAALLRFEL
jgi:DNA-binding SARP family transcriptional activator